MRRLTFTVGLLVLAAALAACTAATRHRVLSTFFDGVPPLPGPEAIAAESATGASARLARGKAQLHGPYASRNCGGCHVGGSSNALVAPVDELCGQCHELDLAKPFVHGPIASGGCLVCHDPHSSAYPFLLVADSATFCLRCHDRDGLVQTPPHQDTSVQCIDCHESHTSDNRYLLR